MCVSMHNPYRVSVSVRQQQIIRPTGGFILFCSCKYGTLFCRPAAVRLRTQGTLAYMFYCFGFRWSPFLSCLYSCLFSRSLLDFSFYLHFGHLQLVDVFPVIDIVHI